MINAIIPRATFTLFRAVYRASVCPWAVLWKRYPANQTFLLDPRHRPTDGVQTLLLLVRTSKDLGTYNLEDRHWVATIPGLLKYSAGTKLQGSAGVPGSRLAGRQLWPDASGYGGNEG